VLRQLDRTDQQDISVGTPAWWRWLEAETTHSFAFRGPSGHFTARKARRRGMYWTAYRKVGGQVVSIYLGKSLALSAARLSEVAAQLTERAARSERQRLVRPAPGA